MGAGVVWQGFQFNGGGGVCMCVWGGGRGPVAEFSSARGIFKVKN